MIKKIFFLLTFQFLFISLFCQVRAIWVTPWDIDTKKKIELVIKDMIKYNFNTLIAEVRYRGDALYTPNRINSDYTNEENRYKTLEGNDFDPLLYLSQICKKNNIKLIAWVTTFVITSHEVDNIGLDHPYFLYYHWVTTDSNGNKMKYFEREGAFFDPGIPQVRDYLFNIFMDIVANYEIDGFQLDYIRYPNTFYGYNPLSLKQYENGEFNSWEEYKINAISGFVKRFYNEAKRVKPSLEISAAVFSNYIDAVQTHSQKWLDWIKDGYLDKAYVMSYTKEDRLVKRDLEFISFQGVDSNIVFGLRAWSDDGKYPVSNINKKIKIVQKYDFIGISFFSYRGIKDHNYFNGLKY